MIPLGFAQPLMLLGLLSLPVLWWLLRLVPPRPRRVSFPPTRMLFDIAPKEETPSRTPWWLTLLRLTLAALVIFAAAGPLWNPPVATSQASAPLALLIDDGWAAASSWDARLRTAEDLIGRAETDNRGVAVVALSDAGRDISLETPGAARVRLRLIKPKPFLIERAEALPALSRFVAASPDIEIVWLADTVDVTNPSATSASAASAFVEGLAKLPLKQSVTIVRGGIPAAHALTAAENAAGGLTVKVLRAETPLADSGVVRALDLKGLPLGETTFSFSSGARETDAAFDLPVEIRNDIARIELASERSAGAVQLLDKRWRRRTVGVITGSSADNAQPLLASTFYLSRALAPFADVRLADRIAPALAISQFIEQRLPMMMMADVGNVDGEARGALGRWVENGGVLVRFAGPRLAAGDDDLVPVKLRRGGRILGGSMSWDKPQQLAAFSRESPFFGMPVPNDVTVTRQVLAEPDSGLSDRTWATLSDGTPLVTAAKRGKGLIVLFHVTADTRWSDLPLSGAFVDMLKRVVGLSGAAPTADQPAGANAASRDVVAPTRILDGFGAFGPPPPTARPAPSGYAGRAKADNPPGFYGPPEGLLAVNTLTATDRLSELDVSALGARIEPYRLTEPEDLRGPILSAALAMLLVDALIVFWLAGGLARLMPRRARAAAILLALAGASLMSQMSPSHAQGEPKAGRTEMRILPGDLKQAQFNSRPGPMKTPAPAPDPKADDFANKATVDTHLAYVITGDAEVDAITKAGLQGLTNFLAQRTALEPGDPIGIDPGRDEMGFFPVVYWPIVPNAGKPSAATLSRIDTYMKQGGTVIFDTRDAGLSAPSMGGENRSPGMMALRNILSSLDVPELEPVQRDHVLMKTFFLLRDFPGRYNTGELWVEAMPRDANEDDEKRPARGGDGVSSIIITSNDFAGAWAIRPDQQPMLPVDQRQREFAYRAGVNLVMYALTGNYKADQVHVPALLERLGQ